MWRWPALYGCNSKYRGAMDIGTLLHCVGRDFLVSAKKVTKEHDKREAL